MVFAAKNCHVDVMELLLQHRATVDLKTTVSGKIHFSQLTITVITYEFSYVFFCLKIYLISIYITIICIVIIMTLSFFINSFCRVIKHL